MKKFLIYNFLLLLSTVPFWAPLSPVYAIVDPLAVPNNKFGIHLIQATPDESSPAAQLVNSSGGDWGYITVLIEGKDKNKDKWQQFFNDLRRKHLIPLVRLATYPDGNTWKIPDIGEAQVWADFLDTLNWPTKNRYVIVYNEPNHAQEWGNKVDASSYAKVLDQTITALKNKNKDFFVLNAGFDASTPQQLPNYQEESSFMQQINDEVPGIFNKLDGFVSHSYPNPGFVGSSQGFGKGSVRTWIWEDEILKDLGVTKRLPIFITETGWKHAEGLNYNPSFPSAETVAQNYIDAFNSAWNSSQIAAVTPFLLSYQEAPFDHFSFKKVKSKDPQIQPANPSASQTSSGSVEENYYPQFQAVLGLPKTKGRPLQDNLAKLEKGEVYSSMVAGENYQISLTFKNTGQSIWGDSETIYLVPLEGGIELGLEKIALPENIKIEPENEYTFRLNLKAPQKGSFKVKLNLFAGGKQFDSKPLEFTTEVKLPVILEILSNLKWKRSAAGEYILKVSGVVGDSSQMVTLNGEGKSQDLEARYLLPDYAFDFTLERPYYHPKTIHQTVKPGINVLDFDTLQPALLQSLFHPNEFWKLLPWSK